MKPSSTFPRLFAGIDAISLDTRKFDISRANIEAICKSFSVGKLIRFEKEKGIVVSHSNFFVYIQTDLGQYALKFYPADATRSITLEHALNRSLIEQDFKTPMMHCTKNGKPYIFCNKHLATCYSYINGEQVWQHLKERGIIRKINVAMFSLKKALEHIPTDIPRLKHSNFSATIREMTTSSRVILDPDIKALISNAIKDACKGYQTHRRYFTRRQLHNNTTLTNFLICNKTVYTLDLSHIQEDYVLSDLASLVLSCLFLDISKSIIQKMIEDYCHVHGLKHEHLAPLDVLIKVGLIKEYLKTVDREISLDPATLNNKLTKTYQHYMHIHKELLLKMLHISWG